MHTMVHTISSSSTGRLEMSNSNAKKRKGEPQPEVEEAGSSRVTNGAVMFDLELVECPVCFEPLAPPTFQVRSFSPQAAKVVQVSVGCFESFNLLQNLVPGVIRLQVARHD
jgi:hypothetical protein